MQSVLVFLRKWWDMEWVRVVGVGGGGSLVLSQECCYVS